MTRAQRTLSIGGVAGQAAAWLAAALLATASPLAAGQADELLAGFENKTTVHRLDNGWTFIIVERKVAPVFSFSTLVDVGGAQEVPGITGLAHMFEHMAFKGTTVIGTTDYAAEAAAIEALEAAYQAYDRRRRDPRADPQEVESLAAAFRTRQTAAAAFVEPNEFSKIIDRAGGVGLNAFTNSDQTTYHYSLPANKIELFAYLESERFLRPVFREFYKERDVVQEERRTRVENNPIGKVIDQSRSVAYTAHPYKQPVVGYMSDLQSFTISDALAFLETYYVPSNMVTAIVGHVDTEQVVALVERYFGRIPAGPEPPALRTVEPPQIAEKELILRERAQPFYAERYHIPSARHPDQAVYDAIDDILSNGRTSRLYRTLVRDRKAAVSIGSFSGTPGRKYPTQWMVYAFPAQGHGNDEVQAAIRGEIERLKTEDVSEEELTRFKVRAKADLVRGLQSNSGLAYQLADNHQLHGDWRQLFRRLDQLEAVTRADIRRVANATFTATNRTVAKLVNADAEAR